MSKRTVLSICTAVMIIVGVLGISYFKFWQEPTAQYTESSNPKLNQIRQDLKKVKLDLKSKGEYNCCIKNDCNWCAIYMEHCPCADLVVKNEQEKSCPECAAAWNRKQGKIPGVDEDAIRVTTFGIYGFEKDGHHHPENVNKKEQQNSKKTDNSEKDMDIDQDQHKHKKQHQHHEHH